MYMFFLEKAVLGLKFEILGPFWPYLGENRRF